MIKSWFYKYEQIVRFYLIIGYILMFSLFFDNELKIFNWMSVIWIIQFFTLITLYALRCIKNGWEIPIR
jgi:uncharacterized protein (DUF983 family)